MDNFEKYKMNLIRISFYSTSYIIFYKYYYRHYLYKIFYGERLINSLVMTAFSVGIFETILKLNKVIKN